MFLPHGIERTDYMLAADDGGGKPFRSYRFREPFDRGRGGSVSLDTVRDGGSSRSTDHTFRGPIAPGPTLRCLAIVRRNQRFAGFANMRTGPQFSQYAQKSRSITRPSPVGDALGRTRQAYGRTVSIVAAVMVGNRVSIVARRTHAPIGKHRILGKRGRS